ncbi:hypothetical protein M427DRAFT_151819 [Gonapodya prolifera JEL478]|uniref:Myb-like domain-containing protein n=1 Tax=Gonapodya prolifera (strain JEL478) TaxID=1344416 RepID=A0A139AUW4_GONPJ|nr:hypothetical protein M427DRAFT_151819 [Gonapodya prolifera JEL478]|eukprot:KXS20489.1 hypothetical protein M427DRAFT_151819 [Gonapodya prolifera JEL478]
MHVNMRSSAPNPTRFVPDPLLDLSLLRSRRPLWTPAEDRALDTAVGKMGKEFRGCAKEVCGVGIGKTLAQVVERFYLKKHELAAVKCSKWRKKCVKEATGEQNAVGKTVQSEGEMDPGVGVGQVPTTTPQARSRSPQRGGAGSSFVRAVERGIRAARGRGVGSSGAVGRSGAGVRSGSGSDVSASKRLHNEYGWGVAEAEFGGVAGRRKGKGVVKVRAVFGSASNVGKPGNMAPLASGGMESPTRHTVVRGDDGMEGIVMDDALLDAERFSPPHIVPALSTSILPDPIPASSILSSPTSSVSPDSSETLFIPPHASEVPRRPPDPAPPLSANSPSDGPLLVRFPSSITLAPDRQSRLLIEDPDTTNGARILGFLSNKRARSDSGGERGEAWVAKKARGDPWAWAWEGETTPKESELGKREVAGLWA